MLKAIKTIFQKSDRRETDGATETRGVHTAYTPGVHLHTPRQPKPEYADVLRSGSVEDAFSVLNKLTTKEVAEKIWYMYPEWRQAILLGQDVLSSRKGRDWISARLTGMRRTWSLTTAGIRLYRVMGLQDGILCANQLYTGTSSVPPYRRKKGIANGK